MGSDRWLAVVDRDDVVVATGRAWPFQQAWGGRHLPIGGVAGVVVDPRVRGRGVGTLLMRSLVVRMHELGDAVSCLYPSMPAIYRPVGYELGGRRPRITLSTKDLRGSVGPDIELRAATAADAAICVELIRADHERRRASGAIVRGEASWVAALSDRSTIAYLASEAGEPSGVVVYNLDGECLTLLTLAGRTEAAVAALWSVVASGSSTADRLKAYVDLRDPVLLAIASNPTDGRPGEPWMTRVLDLPKAVAGRGFSASIDASAVITLTDDVLDHHAGSWRVTVAGGRGSAIRTHEAGLALGPRGLASLWSGWPITAVQAAGLAQGSGDAEALEAIFRADPTMREYF